MLFSAHKNGFWPLAKVTAWTKKYRRMFQGSTSERKIMAKNKKINKIPAVKIKLFISEFKTTVLDMDLFIYILICQSGTFPPHSTEAPLF